MGARKIIVANVGPIGCIPLVRDVNPDADAGDNCVEFINDAVQLFNTQLKCLIKEQYHGRHPSKLHITRLISSS